MDRNPQGLLFLADFRPDTQQGSIQVDVTPCDLTHLATSKTRENCAQKNKPTMRRHDLKKPADFSIVRFSTLTTAVKVLVKSDDGRNAVMFDTASVLAPVQPGNSGRTVLTTSAMTSSLGNKGIEVTRHRVGSDVREPLDIDMTKHRVQLRTLDFHEIAAVTPAQAVGKIVLDVLGDPIGRSCVSLANRFRSFGFMWSSHRRSSGANGT